MNACLAFGEIGRNSSLLLPSGGEGDGEGDITKWSIVTSLLKILKTGSEPNKVRRRIYVNFLFIKHTHISYWDVGCTICASLSLSPPDIKNIGYLEFMSYTRG